MCLVEVEGARKPVASCAQAVSEGMTQILVLGKTTFEVVEVDVAGPKLQKADEELLASLKPFTFEIC